MVVDVSETYCESSGCVDHIDGPGSWISYFDEAGIGPFPSTCVLE